MAPPRAFVAGYQILELLGRGGAGLVYRAFDPEHRREVAVKLLYGELTQGRTRALLEEARAGARVKDQRCVAVYDLAEDSQSGRLLLVSEYVPGIDLARFLALPALSRPPHLFSLPCALLVLEQLVLALKAAHAAGLVHQDLKPQNFLVARFLLDEIEALDRDGLSPELLEELLWSYRDRPWIKLSDWGLALIRKEKLSESLTRSLSLSAIPENKRGGTPVYMAPEQLDGVGISGRSDVFALGMILYEMLTKEPASRGRFYAEGVDINEAGLSSFLAAAIASRARCSVSFEQDPKLQPLKKLRGIPQLLQDMTARLKSERAPLKEVEERLAARLEDWRERGLQLRPSPLRPLLIGLVFLALIGGLVYAWPGKNPEPRAAVSPAREPKPEAITPPSLTRIRSILLDRLTWNAAAEAEQDAAIQHVADKLWASFAFVETREYRCAGIAHRIASFRHLETGAILHLIPGGTFIMGCEEGDEDEAPAHRVSIRPMLIGRFEVRQSLWDKIGGPDQRRWRGPELPIEGVSWEAIADWLTRAGGGLRLPSESEWEYAARAGSETRFFWGEEADASYAWSELNSYYVAPARRGTRPVTRHFQAQKWNAFGLVDASGNVWEWCQDGWLDDYQRGPRDHRARNTERPDTRINRGGAWDSPAGETRSATRDSDEQDEYYSDNVGFRLAASVEI